MTHKDVSEPCLCFRILPTLLLHSVFQLRPSRLYLIPARNFVLAHSSPWNVFLFFLSIVNSCSSFSVGFFNVGSITYTICVFSRPLWYLYPRTFCLELSLSVSSPGCELLEGSACVYLNSQSPLVQ